MSEAPSSQTDPTGSWDYIIIGAGTAGCILANRLSADGKSKVLVIEAGGEDNKLRYKLVAMSTECMNNPESDWMFLSEPDPTRSGKVDLMSRGKVVGGSSSINGSIYVRGNRGDYDAWAQMGNRGWSYDDILPYFRRVEGNRDGISDTYGKSGPVVVGGLRGVPRLSYVFVEAMAELGYGKNRSYNGDPAEGASIIQANQHLGVRYSAARAYLHPARNRLNLRVVTHAFVRRVLFDGRRAVGVEYDVDGRTVTERASREVILSASAFNSPKILMLSGIGDPAQLAAANIPVLHANPAVGRNLQDHPATNVKGLVNVHTANLDDNLLGKLKHGLRFAFTRGGEATFVHSALALIRTRPELEWPDVQFHFGAFAYEFTPKGLKMLDRPAVTLQPNINRTRSRGHVELRSGDFRDPPRIFPNMLSDPHDIETLVAAAKIGRAALKTKAFAPYVVGEYKPGKDVQADDEWIAYTREVTSHIYHACGTCKMGIDPQAVVDPELKVIGVEGLRVIDCSIIPQVPSGNTHAITLAIGEKGSDLVLNSRQVA
jgi:choline dehydrogenase